MASNSIDHRLIPIMHYHIVAFHYHTNTYKHIFSFMRKHFLTKSSALLVNVVTIASVSLTGCVDNDYDLSKDMDLNVTIGGETIYLPASSTGKLTMDNILDLGSESSIKTITAKDVADGTNYGLVEGDYVLVQNADPTYSSVKVEQVHLKDTRFTSDGVTVPFAPGLEFTMPADFTSEMSISDNNVDKNLMSVKEAVTDMEMVFDVYCTSDVYNGDITINKGYVIEFSEGWNVTISDPATAAFARMLDYHTLVFMENATFDINHPLELRINVDRFILGDTKGEGLYEPGHFQLDTSIHFAGNISIDDNTTSSQVGAVDLNATLKVENATLLAITGVVDPDINIDDTQVAIEDVPDFLNEKDNNLDIANPQIYFTVNNGSPVSVTFTALLRSIYHDGKAPVDVHIGKWENGKGTEEILVKPGLNRICLSRTGESTETDVVNISVPDIANLLATIPDEISITDVDAKVIQEPVTFELTAPGEPGYEFETAYEAVVPIAFGSALRLTYDDTETGWDEDFEKYNFNTVSISMDVVNSVPLTLKPDAEFIYGNEQTFDNVTVDVEGDVVAGSVAAPVTSHIVITATSHGKNLNGLNGIRYIFSASTTEAAEGVVLNKNQSLKFENIKISIKGGVTIDLND